MKTDEEHSFTLFLFLTRPKSPPRRARGRDERDHDENPHARQTHLQDGDVPRSLTSPSAPCASPPVAAFADLYITPALRPSASRIDDRSSDERPRATRARNQSLNRRPRSSARAPRWDSRRRTSTTRPYARSRGTFSRAHTFERTRAVGRRARRDEVRTVARARPAAGLRPRARRRAPRIGCFRTIRASHALEYETNARE